jgi:hypothetical protein
MTDEPQKTPEELIEEMEEAQQPISREDVRQEFVQAPPGSSQPDSKSNAVPIVGIIAASVIILGCIFACAAVAYGFMINAPW